MPLNGEILPEKLGNLYWPDALAYGEFRSSARFRKKVICVRAIAKISGSREVNFHQKIRPPNPFGKAGQPILGEYPGV